MIRRRRELLGDGSVHSAVPGTTFELADHARHGGTDAEQRRFLITAVTHPARNNLATDLPATAGFGRNRVRLDLYMIRRQREAIDARQREMLGVTDQHIGASAGSA